MGQPGWLKASHHQMMGRTGGTETSKYPQEKKEIIDVGSSGDRTRQSPNRYCFGSVGVVGVIIGNESMNWNDLESSTAEGDSPVEVS